MGPIFKELLILYPNDMDLGGHVRVLGKLMKHRGFMSMSEKYPNDMELGSEARKELIKK